MRKSTTAILASSVLFAGGAIAQDASIALDASVPTICGASVTTPVTLDLTAPSSGSIFIQCNGGEGVDIRMNSQRGSLDGGNGRKLAYSAELDLSAAPNSESESPFILEANNVSPNQTGDVEIFATVGGSETLALGIEAPLTVTLVDPVIFSGTYTDVLTVSVTVN